MTSRTEPVDIAQLRIGDRILLKSGESRTIEMVVWRIEPPMSAGRRQGAGPAVSAWISPGGYGVTIDRDVPRGYIGRL